MPRVQSTSFAIDREWAASLRGLRMNVPDDWWPGFTSNNLNGGVIARVDLDIATNNHFQLELDNEPGSFYAMRYDAVVRYADETHRSFSSFRLPAHALSDPANEAVVVEDVDEDDDDEDDFLTPPPARNKRRRLQKKQTTINPDSRMFGEEGTADGGMADDANEQAAIDEVVVPARRRRCGRVAAAPVGTGRRTFVMTKPGDWTKLNAANPGRPIDPIPFTGLNEFFGVNMTDAEMESMKDKNGDIRYNKIFEWMLPTFGDTVESFWEFVAGRMRSYMTHLMMQGWKPRWFDPDNGTIILADHVARMFGCQQCRSIRGFPSIDECWSTRCPLDSIAPLKESMPRDAFTDMYRCLHFADDFDEDEEWSDIFFDEKHVSPETAKHRRKFGEVEDAINRRWKECVTAGMAMTHDESRIAGWWYHSIMTIGPEPKPIRTGSTLHSLAVTFGILAGYKLHARTFGGRSDGDLDMRHENVETIQKWINLMSIMIDESRARGNM